MLDFNPYGDGTADHKTFESIKVILEQSYLSELQFVSEDLKKLIPNKEIHSNVQNYLKLLYEDFIFDFKLLPDATSQVVSLHNKISEHVYFNSAEEIAYRISSVPKLEVEVVSNQNVPVLNSFGKELHELATKLFQKYSLLPTGINVVQKSDTEYLLITASSFFNSVNKYSGNSSREYKIVKSSNEDTKYTISGSLKASAHIFENSNTVVDTTWPLKEATHSSVAELMKHIEKCEQQLIDRFVNNLDDADVEVFKLLRMQMPYTKSLIDFEKEYYAQKNKQ